MILTIIWIDFAVKFIVLDFVSPREILEDLESIIVSVPRGSPFRDRADGGKVGNEDRSARQKFRFRFW